MKPTPDAPLPIHIQIRLLGGFRAVRNGAPVEELEKSRTRALLAYLILHSAAPVSRQQLAYALWPDTSDKQALTNLRTLLFRLRRALADADHFLTVTGQTIQWRTDAPLNADIFEFEQALVQAEQAANDNQRTQALDRAVAAYGGDLLPDCYDDWIAPDRERLRDAYLRALEALALMPPAYPFRWAALWPLIGVAMERREFATAMNCVRQLLDPTQQRLSDEMTPALEATLTAWDGEEVGESDQQLHHAAEIAVELGYL